MDYVSSVKMDRWSSSDISDQEENNKKDSLGSSSSSFRRKKSLKKKLSRNLSRVSNVEKNDKSSKMEIDRSSHLEVYDDPLVKTNETMNKNGKDTTASSADDPDYFDAIEYHNVTNDLTPKLNLYLTNVTSNDPTDSPSLIRRSAVRIRRKGHSFAGADGVVTKFTDEKSGKLSLREPVSLFKDPQQERKTSLQVPISSMELSTSPMSDNPLNFKTYVDIHGAFNEENEDISRSASPNCTTPFDLNKPAKEKRKRKHRRVSSILKPVWESKRVSSFVEQASEKAKPFLESEVGSYLIEKVEKVEKKSRKVILVHMIRSK